MVAVCLGVPARILAIRDSEALPIACVAVDGVARDVSLAYTPDARVGDYVVLHLGFAISRLDEAEARRVLATLDLAEADDTEQGSSAT